MLLGAVEARFSHGLLIIAAPESIDTHGDWDAATGFVHPGPDSLYIGVRDAATGLVRVRCFDEPADEDSLPVLYSGELELPSAQIRLYDPNDAISMTLSLDDVAVTVTVLGNDDREPSELAIYFGAQLR